MSLSQIIVKKTDGTLHNAFSPSTILNTKVVDMPTFEINAFVSVDIPGTYSLDERTAAIRNPSSLLPTINSTTPHPLAKKFRFIKPVFRKGLVEIKSDTQKLDNTGTYSFDNETDNTDPPSESPTLTLAKTTSAFIGMKNNLPVNKYPTITFKFKHTTTDANTGKGHAVPVEIKVVSQGEIKLAPTAQSLKIDFSSIQTIARKNFVYTENTPPTFPIIIGYGLTSILVYRKGLGFANNAGARIDFMESNNKEVSSDKRKGAQLRVTTQAVTLKRPQLVLTDASTIDIKVPVEDYIQTLIKRNDKIINKDILVITEDI